MNGITTTSLTAPAASSATAGETAPGWYGKLSSLGDFAQRRLPAHWVKHSDAWLATLMHELPGVLGPRWLESYLTAPVLRFAWAPGVVDMRWWFGVLMPSCDKVGRYFPLLVAQARSLPPLDLAGLEHLDDWYAALARAALATLEDDASVEGFEQALAAAPAWPLPAAASPQPMSAANPWQRALLPESAPASTWLPQLAAGELLERLAGCSLWWPRSEAGGVPGELRWGPGLPSSGEFAALLRGPAA